MREHTICLRPCYVLKNRICCLLSKVNRRNSLLACASPSTRKPEGLKGEQGNSHEWGRVYVGVGGRGNASLRSAWLAKVMAARPRTGAGVVRGTQLNKWAYVTAAGQPGTGTVRVNYTDPGPHACNAHLSNGCTVSMLGAWGHS